MLDNDSNTRAKDESRIDEDVKVDARAYENM